MATHNVNDAADLVGKLRSAAPGDTILVSGRLGAVDLRGIRPERRVTVAPAAPGAAHLERLTLAGCANLAFSGLTFWPLSPVAKANRKQYLVTAFPDCSDIELSDSLFRGRADSDGHASWARADWDAAKIGAALLRGPRSSIRGCTAIGVYFGYGVSGESSEIFNNIVSGFSGDGLRVTENNCVVIGNRITDAMQIDENHSDGFQAFKTKGLLDGIVVKDNVLAEWTVRPDNPLRAKMQGISFHGGPYANVVVRDNSVATSAYHGMNVNAVTNLEITGNRIRHADGLRGKFPWIRVQNSSGRMVVENNEAEDFRLQPGVIATGNREPDYARRF